MSFRYITIEREYGSGGTEIARRLAKECNISCYGEEILEAVSKKAGVPVDQIQRYEETVSNSFLYTAFLMSRAQTGNADMLTNEGHIFVAEQQEIKNLAASGSAVFIGHCASEALRGKDVIKVFIRSSDSKEKARRISEEYGVDPKNAEGVRSRFDNKRAKYYYANTSKKWDDLKNYDIVLDSAKLGIDGCVSVLKGVFGNGHYSDGGI